ncbi:hypothetical protein Aduo_009873 [Ancylostoma duodenale]
MRTTPIILLAFCVTASTSVYCPKSYVITKNDVEKSYFVALVEAESSKETQDSYGKYYEFGLKYEKLFQWWHYWVAQSYIIYDAPKSLRIHRWCSIRLQPGQKYVLGCKSFSECHFVKAYNSLTPAEKKLVEQQ